MNPMWIIPLVAGLSVLMIFVGLAQLNQSQEVIAERLDRYAVREALVAAETPSRRKRESALAEKLNKLIARRSFAASIATELARADLRLTVAEFLMLNVASALLGFMVALLAYRSLPAGLIGSVLGFYAPRWYVRFRQRRRLIAFNNQLGDCINLLANSLRSGYSLLQSMQTVANELPPPISTEFARVIREVGLGLSTEQAMNNMLRRIQSDDLDLMITAINVQHEVGGNLAEILEIIGYTIRERVRIKGEIRVLTAQQMLTGYIIGFLPVGIGAVLFLINREYMGQMFTDPCGWVMIGVAVTIVGLGFFVIRKIVAIEV